MEAIRLYEKAGEFDPRYHIIWFNIGGVWRQLRQFDQADAMLARTLTLQPNFLDARLDRVDVQLAKNGDVATARQRFDSTAALIPPDRWRPLPSMWLGGLMRTLFPAPSERLTLIKAGTYGLDSSFAQLVRAEALIQLGARGPAAATHDSATKTLQRAYEVSPKTPWNSAALAVAYGLAGRKAEAVASVKRAQVLMSDALDGPPFIMLEAYVQMLVGERDAALNALQLSLQIPGGTSASLLKVNPDFAPLRNDPRFQAMLAKGSPPPPDR
jgi:tetratricopeptide (TPR) repeat protein